MNGTNCSPGSTDRTTPKARPDQRASRILRGKGEERPRVSGKNTASGKSTQEGPEGNGAKPQKLNKIELNQVKLTDPLTVIWNQRFREGVQKTEASDPGDAGAHRLYGREVPTDGRTGDTVSGEAIFKLKWRRIFQS